MTAALVLLARVYAATCLRSTFLLAQARSTCVF